jgi:hypothetical protein
VADRHRQLVRAERRRQVKVLDRATQVFWATAAGWCVVYAIVVGMRL